MDPRNAQRPIRRWQSEQCKSELSGFAIPPMEIETGIVSERCAITGRMGDGEEGVGSLTGFAGVRNRAGVDGVTEGALDSDGVLIRSECAGGVGGSNDHPNKAHKMAASEGSWLAASSSFWDIEGKPPSDTEDGKSARKVKSGVLTDVTIDKRCWT